MKNPRRKFWKFMKETKQKNTDSSAIWILKGNTINTIKYTRKCSLKHNIIPKKDNNTYKYSTILTKTRYCIQNTIIITIT